MQHSKEHAVLVAELPEGGIAGWIGVFIFRSVELDASAEISGFVVGEEARSKGVGGILLIAAEAWARDQGCREIVVHCNVIRERAHRFYESNAFEHKKTQKVFQKTL
jgi:GNAT superfamily N-acetyltransferase